MDTENIIPNSDSPILDAPDDEQQAEDKPEKISISRAIGHFLFRNRIVLEIVFLLWVALSIMTPYIQYDPNTRLPGREGEYLYSRIEIAHESLLQDGYIPLWNPSYRFGEPLVDHPASFILNPFTSIPSLIYGAIQGTKTSVAVAVILAALGGWFLGYVLGLNTGGRVLLGLLLLGRGNMAVSAMEGWFQLSVAQSYFPWILAGLISIILYRTRWSIVLTALSCTLLFWVGAIWYIPPIAVLMTVIVFGYGYRKSADGFTLLGWKQVAVAGLLTFALSAILLLPSLITTSKQLSHPEEISAGWEIVDRTVVFDLFFSGTYGDADIALRDPKNGAITRGWPEIYYNYTAPLWFILFLILTAPLHRSQVVKPLRLWLIIIGFIILMVIWGLGGIFPFPWLYEQFELVRQWRFVGRALGLASFAITILIAMRFDGLLNFFSNSNWQRFIPAKQSQLVKAIIVVGIFIVGINVGQQVIKQSWRIRPNVEPINSNFDQKISWLRYEYAKSDVSVWRMGYSEVAAFVKFESRLVNIEDDHSLGPKPYTINTINLIWRRFPEFAAASDEGSKSFLLSEGYEPIANQPNIPGDTLYQHPAFATPYTFTATIDDIQSLTSFRELPTIAQPVLAYERHPDIIAVVAQSNPTDPSLLIIDETSYPGWHAKIDGKSVAVESAGGLVGVKLPLDTEIHQVVFQYRPGWLVFGAYISLLSAILSILFLLKIDKWLRMGDWRITKYIQRQIEEFQSKYTW